MAPTAHDYAGALSHARAAYAHVLDGAQRASVRVEESENGWTVLPKPKPKRDERAGGMHYAAFDKIGPGTKRSQR